MREAAERASVTWDYQTIGYKRKSIGFPNGNSTDTIVIQDQLETITGERPIEIDEPTIEAGTDQTQ
jgi:hypothetical protein